MAEVNTLQKSNEALKRELVRMRKINKRLSAEVVDLKTGHDAVEERARGELGMIRDGETFYQIVDKPELKEDE